MCSIIKNDDLHHKYPQSMPMVMVTAIEDEEYYSTRNPGIVHPADEVDLTQDQIDGSTI